LSLCTSNSPSSNDARILSNKLLSLELLLGSCQRFYTTSPTGRTIPSGHQSQASYWTRRRRIALRRLGLRCTFLGLWRRVRRWRGRDRLRRRRSCRLVGPRGRCGTKPCLSEGPEVECRLSVGGFGLCGRRSREWVLYATAGDRKTETRLRCTSAERSETEAGLCILPVRFRGRGKDEPRLYLAFHVRCARERCQNGSRGFRGWCRSVRWLGCFCLGRGRRRCFCIGECRWWRFRWNWRRLWRFCLNLNGFGCLVRSRRGGKCFRRGRRRLRWFEGGETQWSEGERFCCWCAFGGLWKRESGEGFGRSLSGSGLRSDRDLHSARRVEPGRRSFNLWRWRWITGDCV
jgi:hypothetical protein